MKKLHGYKYLANLELNEAYNANKVLNLFYNNKN